MLSIRNVFNAFTNLAASLNGLAGVIDLATGRLRQQLAPEDTPALEHAGVVLDNSAETGPSTKRGRKSA